MNSASIPAAWSGSRASGGPWTVMPLFLTRLLTAAATTILAGMRLRRKPGALWSVAGHDRPSRHVVRPHLGLWIGRGSVGQGRPGRSGSALVSRFSAWPVIRRPAVPDLRITMPPLSQTLISDSGELDRWNLELSMDWDRSAKWSQFRSLRRQRRRWLDRVGRDRCAHQRRSARGEMRECAGPKMGRTTVWRGRAGQAFVPREPGVDDGTTADSLAADCHAPQ